MIPGYCLNKRKETNKRKGTMTPNYYSRLIDGHKVTVNGITHAWNLDADEAQAVQYILRAKYKEDEIKDLEKAIDFLDMAVAWKKQQKVLDEQLKAIKKEPKGCPTGEPGKELTLDDDDDDIDWDELDDEDDDIDWDELDYYWNEPDEDDDSSETPFKSPGAMLPDEYEDSKPKPPVNKNEDFDKALTLMKPNMTVFAGVFHCPNFKTMEAFQNSLREQGISYATEYNSDASAEVRIIIDES